MASALSSIQTNKDSIASLSENVKDLLFKPNFVSYSTPKPSAPPGFLPKTIFMVESPFVPQNAPPGFVTPDISQVYSLVDTMALKTQQNENDMLSEISPTSSAHENFPAGLQSLCVAEKSTVSHDTDESVGLSPVPSSVSPVNSRTAVTPSPVMQPQHGQQSEILRHLQI